MAVARTFRVNVTTTKTNKNLPENIKFAILKNAGSNKMAFNFDDDGANDFFSLEAGESVISPIHISSGQKIHYRSIGGDTTLEVVAWG